MNIIQEGNASHYEKCTPKKRGRHKVEDPLETVRISVNNSIICQGKIILNIDSKEYDDYLQAFKKKLFDYINNELKPK